MDYSELLFLVSELVAVRWSDIQRDHDRDLDIRTLSYRMGVACATKIVKGPSASGCSSEKHLLSRWMRRDWRRIPTHYHYYLYEKSGRVLVGGELGGIPERLCDNRGSLSFAPFTMSNCTIAIGNEDVVAFIQEQPALLRPWLATIAMYLLPSLWESASIKDLATVQEKQELEKEVQRFRTRDLFGLS